MARNKNKSAISNQQSAILLLVFCLLTLSGCRRDMQDQPKMKPYRGSNFFGDGLSARPPVEGTVPRGFLRTDTALFTGKKNKNLSNISARPQLHQPVRNLQPVRFQDRTFIQTTSIPSHSQSRKRQYFAAGNVTTSSVLFVTERPDTATA
jgi:hypothetical protein